MTEEKKDSELKAQEYQLQIKEYKLKRDEQVSAYLESKQKLTYFVISGAVAIVGLLLDFLFKNREAINISLLWAIAPIAAGLLSAGVALIGLYYLHESTKLHLVYLHMDREWESLSIQEKARWDSKTQYSSYALYTSIVLLFLEVFLAALFLLGSLLH
jgi:hypothetical protein